MPRRCAHPAGESQQVLRGHGHAAAPGTVAQHAADQQQTLAGQPVGRRGEQGTLGIVIEVMQDVQQHHVTAPRRQHGEIPRAQFDRRPQAARSHTAGGQLARIVIDAQIVAAVALFAQPLAQQAHAAAEVQHRQRCPGIQQQRTDCGERRIVTQLAVHVSLLPASRETRADACRDPRGVLRSRSTAGAGRFQGRW